MKIPESYKKASWRNTTNTDGKEIGIGFDTDAETIRVRLNLECARHLAESINDYVRSHSDKSCEMPSVAVSTPRSTD